MPNLTELPHRVLSARAPSKFASIHTWQIPRPRGLRVSLLPVVMCVAYHTIEPTKPHADLRLTETSQMVAVRDLSLKALANPSICPAWAHLDFLVLRIHRVACVLSKAVCSLPKSLVGKPTWKPVFMLLYDDPVAHDCWQQLLLTRLIHTRHYHWIV